MMPTLGIVAQMKGEDYFVATLGWAYSPASVERLTRRASRDTATMDGSALVGTGTGSVDRRGLRLRFDRWRRLKRILVAELLGDLPGGNELRKSSWYSSRHWSATSALSAPCR